MTGVLIASLTGGITPGWHDCIQSLLAYDRTHNGNITGHLTKVPGAGDLDGGRNWLTSAWLDDTDAEWLWMVDSDMVFQPDIVDLLLSAAHPKDRPVVGGLCFGARPAGTHRGIPEMRMFPTIYAEHDGTLKHVWSYPKNQLVRVAATGAACLLIHRSAAETVRGNIGDHWWSRVVWNGNRYSEDLSFCLQMTGHDIPVYVHTGIHTGHIKEAFLDDYAYRHQPSGPNVVVIPAKDNGDMTRRLICQLAGQPVDLLLLYDNGSTDGTGQWADARPDVVRVDAAGWNIHQMWNDGIERALALSGHANVFFLNNDIEVDDRFVVEMAAGLRDSDHAVVSPNYDGRPRTSRFDTLQGICAGRYDGTGGMAGFAFAVKGHLFANGYRFPEDCQWWYGDTDLMLTLQKNRLTQGMVLDATCEHVNGGGQTGRWDDPEWAPILEQDRKAFLARWPELQDAAA